MIIIGYQGIGKSTLSARNLKYVDLESSNFWFDDPETKQRVRHFNWYEMYCNVAEYLSRQGYVVFVSSKTSCKSAAQIVLSSNPKFASIYATCTG